MSSQTAELFERVEELEQHRDSLLRSLDQARADLRAERRRADKALRHLHALDPDHEELDPADFTIANRLRAYVRRRLFFIVAIAFMAVWMTLIALFGRGPAAPPLPPPPTPPMLPLR